MSKARPVITDNFNTIPERYRARVKTTDQAIDCSPELAAGTIQETLVELGEAASRYGFRSCPRTFPGSLLHSRRF